MNTIIQSAIEYIKDIFSNDFGGHDVEHSMRVYYNALQIASTEPTCNLFIVSLAALLHDVDDYKLFNTVNNENARYFLNMHNMDNEMIDSICNVINSVSYSKNKGLTPTTLDAKIVQDADRLDAIGAIGIARTFAFGGERKRKLTDTIQHFYDKLLLLKDMMNTDEGKRMAIERHIFLEQFLDKLLQEMYLK